MNFQFSTPIASFYYSSTFEKNLALETKKGSPLISALAKIVFLHFAFAVPHQFASRRKSSFKSSVQIFDVIKATPKQKREFLRFYFCETKQHGFQSLKKRNSNNISWKICSFFIPHTRMSLLNSFRSKNEENPLSVFSFLRRSSFHFSFWYTWLIGFVINLVSFSCTIFPQHRRKSY